MYHIDDFAALAATSRREIDRMAIDEEIERVKWHGVTLIPAEFLNRFSSSKEPEREQKQAGRPADKAQFQPEATAATPWEELSYEAL
jgi:hypothetical protein